MFPAEMRSTMAAAETQQLDGDVVDLEESLKDLEIA